MGLLTKCPECHNTLYADDPRDIQICKVCDYWTKKNTASVEFVLLCDEAVMLYE
ncbi:hypothetical protein [Methanolobus psychrotolerans]|uniref:hypothetical protein n=1 Tax=Methanolobus psychrotolerans TaxID=1874706 RepID=UPI0013EC3AC4|nr:hypothetical protein [Methanolobus psychrotolerans]